jgi:ferredoxin
MNIRKVRIAVAGAVLVLFTTLFVGGKTDAVLALAWLPRSQFVPALLKAVGGVVGTGVAILAGLLLLALLFGRVYCSFLCPLGILQDVFIWIARRVGRRRKGSQGKRTPSPRPLKAYPVVWYGVLVLTTFTCLLGSFTLVNLLDPYSLFGRIMRDIFLPPLSAVRYFAAWCLEHFDVFALSGPNAYLPAWWVWTVSASCLLVLVVMAAARGRLYCNSVCPVGALLGVLARVAPFRIRVRAGDCVECGLCEQQCPAGCIDIAAADKVDVSRCVMCMDCIGVCPREAVLLAGAPTTRPAPDALPDRRRFLAGSASSFSMVLLGFPFRARVLDLLAQSKPVPIVPPGAGSVARFSQRCTGCHLCVAACWYHVIKPSMASYGNVGTMQPVMDYSSGFCFHECNRCGRVCPTGAIEPLSIEEKKLTRIGSVRLIEKLCVVYAHHADCGACAELCPTHAVYTEEKDGLLYPKIDQKFCIGCGACENVCPQWPKAILVDPIVEHGFAVPPFTGQPEPETAPRAVNVDEKFPF